ncbi:MAG: formylglycine-generating enzyme family protein [Gemmataceae bacterium]|nr:formylglycine-generating enzyme family protein [Gemmataceae bacterium]
MRSFIKYPIALSFVLGIASLSLFTGPDAPAQLPPKLPVIEKAEHQSYTEKFEDKFTIDMVAIPGGTYLMGSPEGEKGRSADEGPQRPVSVKPFWMAKLEITWEEYDWFWSKRPGGPPPRPDISKKPDKLPDALTSPTPPYEDETFGYGRNGQPTIAVTHHAAMEFCRWLSDITKKTYRLPTEAEWEWACRAGTTTAYGFGDDPKKLGEYEWFEGNAEEKPQKVGKKKPNPWGLYDMQGNAAEWCIDRYKKDFFSGLPTEKPSLNPFNPPNEFRYGNVARGGSFLDPPGKCRAAVKRVSDKKWMARDPQRPQSIWWMTEADYVGFRVVRAVEEYENLKGIRSKVTWWSD